MNKNVTAVILIVLSVGIYLEFTGKVWKDAQAVGMVNKQYQEAIRNADELVSQRDKVLQEYNALSLADQDRLNKMIPTAVDNIRLIIDLNSVALRRGITLTGIKAVTSEAPAMQTTVTPTTSGGGDVSVPSATSAIVPSTVTVSFGTTATYQQFIQFLRDVEANLHVMDLSSLKVSAHDDGKNDYTVELKTYWLRQQ